MKKFAKCAICGHTRRDHDGQVHPNRLPNNYVAPKYPACSVGWIVPGETPRCMCAKFVPDIEKLVEMIRKA